MADNWATFSNFPAFQRSLDLHLDVRRGGRGIGAALTHALRDAVRGGRLTPGTRLPSSRALAADLGLARNTVADAYAELVAEGWLTARQGSGTRVAERAAPRRGRAGRPAPPPEHPLNPRVAYNLMPGTPDASAFPRAAWAAATRRALTAAPSDAFGYQTSAGRPELRRALAGYLARARGVDVTPDRIVVCSGFMHGLRLLAQVLRARGARRVAVEAYGLGIHREALTAGGLRTEPLPYDAASGTRTDGLTAHTHAALLTPSHQFPTGVPLLPEQRQAAIDWARRTGGLLLEDDYDGEFRYDRQPVGALQGLDPEHVAYVGTASKSLSPALRLGWLVLPTRLLPEVLAAKGEAEGYSSGLDQLTLAEFIDSGAYDRHVRAMRQRYRRRRDHLVAALAARAPHIRVTGIAAGLQALIELPPGTEQSAVDRARREGLAVSHLAFHAYAPSGSARDALIAGYGAPPDHLFPGAVAALCRALG
jgi:GntR family transcriptional regulator / MocR family aminotransferase